MNNTVDLKINSVVILPSNTTFKTLDLKSYFLIKKHLSFQNSYILTIQII